MCEISRCRIGNLVTAFISVINHEVELVSDQYGYHQTQYVHYAGYIITSATRTKVVCARTNGLRGLSAKCDDHVIPYERL